MPEWLSVWSKAKMICIWSIRHAIISYLVKLQNVLLSWCWLTHDTTEKTHRTSAAINAKCQVKEFWTACGKMCKRA